MRTQNIRLAAVLVVAAAAPALAAGTRVWRVTSYKDFDEGEEEGVLVSSLGEALTGYGAARLDLPVAQVFSAATTPDGAVWLGTGDQAEVYRWDGGKAPQRSCRLEGVLVSALAAAPDGTVYAGTMPGGRLWAAKAGAPCREIAKLDGADQIWALLVDAPKHTLYAATGPNGKLYAVDLPSGKNRVRWDSGEKHLLALARGADGALLAGSADEAIVYRVGDDGRARALQDFAGDEVRALAVGPGGVVYAAVNEFERKAPAAAAATAGSTTGATAAGGAVRPNGIRMALPNATPAAGPQPPGRDRKGKGAVFRLDPDGRVEQVHALADGYFTALAVDRHGALFAAAGANGRVYEVLPDRTLLTAFGFPERQVLALSLDGAHPAIGTGDSGALYAIDFATPKSARYFTKVLDAGASARWGAIRWSPSGTIRIDTRSGNTAHPDRSWSDWQAPAQAHRGAPAGREQFEGKVASPPGRYLQVRAGFGKESRLHDVSVSYLPQNQRARVTEITVGEDPGSHVARAAKPAAGKPRSPVVKVRWKVENPDDDELVFRLFYREESDPSWKPLGGPDPLTTREFDWNTEIVPDGNYLLRVVASDERANPKEDALEHELVSTPYLVDNRKPEVTRLAFSGGAVSGLARDSFSPVSELAYAIDAGEFLPLAPRDRLLDELSEEFIVRLPVSLSPGSHSITVRATDAADNVGLGQLTFQVGRK